MTGGAAWWVAPSYNVAAVGWRQLRGLGLQIEGAKISEVDRKVEFPGGGWYQVRSADDPDSLRGDGLNRLVMDECSFVAEKAWTEALRPALSDRKGDALFISTPKGQNWFWRMWIKGQEGGAEWQSWSFPSVANPFLDPNEVESARGDIPERVYEQEYLAKFLEDAGGVFRKVRDAVDLGRVQPDAPRPNDRYVIGVDLARVEDFTVVTVLDGRRRQCYHERFNQISWERQIESIKAVARKFPGAVVVDSTGVGDPICEALKRSQVRVVPYHLSNQSKESAIDRLALLLEQGAIRLMDVPAQTNELLAYQYELTPSRNVRMNAPQGMHDDCVIALALAAWGSGKYANISVQSAESESDRKAREEAERLKHLWEGQGVWR